MVLNWSSWRKTISSTSNKGIQETNNKGAKPEEGQPRLKRTPLAMDNRNKIFFLFKIRIIN